MDEKTARAQAVDALLRIEEEGAFVGRVQPEGEDARGVRQAAEYVGGVTRLKRWLDYVLARHYRGEVAALEPRLRQILRVGLYDVLELNTPPHAAVSEAVDLARATVRPGAGALVNAVLRAALREGAPPEPDTGDRARDLAIRHSHPTWMVRRWLPRFGVDETLALLRANNARPHHALRVNTRKTTRASLAQELDALGVAHRPSAYLDDFLVVERLQPVVRAGFLRDGRCAVQDEAAALVVHVLDPQPDETILDAASAPGGKALYAALRMGDVGRVLAFDVNDAKAKLITRAASAHGLTSITVEAAELRSLAARPDAPMGDRVLLDAPCSGTGVLARRADLRWRRTPESLVELMALQDELLDAAARLVRPGGLLVYATCSLELEENEARVAAFLARNESFAAETVGPLVPAPMQTPGGHYAALPHRHDTDGAFAARIRRVG